MKTSLIALAVAASIALIAVLIVYSLRREAEVEELWRAFARKHGYRWIDATGNWLMRRRAYVVGVVAGVAFELERQVVRRGKSRVMYTRVRTLPLGGPSERVLVTRRGWRGRLESLFEGPVVETGDRDFDEHLLVRSKSQRAAKELLLRDPARKLALAFPRALRLESKPGVITLRWRNAERDPAVLAAGVELATALASSAERARTVTASK